MSKPLELRIFPPRNPEPSERLSDEWLHWHMYDSWDKAEAQAKRLTDAELAAEYWRASLQTRVRHARHEFNKPSDVLWEHYQQGLKEEWVLERFATHPHYDEVPA